MKLISAPKYCSTTNFENDFLILKNSKKTVFLGKFLDYDLVFSIVELLDQLLFALFGGFGFFFGLGSVFVPKFRGIIQKILKDFQVLENLIRFFAISAGFGKR